MRESRGGPNPGPPPPWDLSGAVPVNGVLCRFVPLQDTAILWLDTAKKLYKAINLFWTENITKCPFLSIYQKQQQIGIDME